MGAPHPAGIVKEVLPNGLRVVVEPLPNFTSVSIGVWVLVGSRDEDPRDLGISHLIEHLAFKGTPRRSARQIALEVDALGGALNAFTSKECTSYYVRALGESLSEALDILGDLTLNSLFQDEDLVKEREVVVQEISMLEDSPEELVHELHAQDFWPGHGLGWSIMGTPDSLKGIGRGKVVDFHRTWYRPSSLVIAASGKVIPDEFIPAVERLFGPMPAGEAPLRREPPRPSPALKVVTRPLEQVHFCAGFEGFPVTDERRYALLLLNTVLGGGMSSRLFQEIREERGLAYSVYSYHASYEDAGLLTVYCGTTPDHFPKALSLIRAEAGRLTQEPIPEKELGVAKRQLKGSILLGLESSGNRMNQLAKNEIHFGRQHSPEEIAERIEGVTPAGILEVARSVLNLPEMALTVMGPLEEDAVRGAGG